MPQILIRKQIRLKNYDYSSNGWYFITVCSRDRKNIFGEYKNIVGEGLAPSRYENNIQLSKLGQIIDAQWQNIEKQYDDIRLDEYIIMPNHIHGILIIDKRAGASPAPTIYDIIRSFKSKSSVEYLRYVKQNNLGVSGQIWQRSFYDRIIRNERSLNAIREYISHNPINWERDIDNLLDL